MVGRSRVQADARARRVLLGLLLGVGIWGCNKDKAPPPPAPTAAPLPSPPDAASPECTLATPLVPGVPGSPGHLIPSDRNPNGVSELAKLMRNMQYELANARGQILRGEEITKMRARFSPIRCSWPTTPGDRNESFDASARAYLAAVSALDAAPPAGRAAAFDGVLNACRACHEHTCTGAIVAIEGLRIAPMSSPAQP